MGLDIVGEICIACSGQNPASIRAAAILIVSIELRTTIGSRRVSKTGVKRAVIPTSEREIVIEIFKCTVQVNTVAR